MTPQTTKQQFIEKCKKMKISKEYCSHCGRMLEERKPITADNFGIGFYHNAPFDKKTGKVRMRHWVACPKYIEFGKSWNPFNRGYMHDAHAIGKEYLI